MSDANSIEPLLNLIRELRILFRATADSLAGSHPELSANILSAGKTLKRLESRLSSKSFVVAFTGLTNVGKSTIMNALLGANLASRSNRPWSSAPVEYVYGDELGATVIFERSITRYMKNCGSVEELFELIVRSASETGDLAQRGVKKMTVRLPFNILKDGLVIVDTPGFGAAQLGDRKGEHERVLLEYLPKADQVFWIISSEQGITANEMAFHEHYMKDVCDDVIVNLFDEYSDNDIKRFLGRFGGKVSITTRWHFVSALYALKAKTDGDSSGLDESGIKNLEERLWQLASADKRRGSIERDILRLCDDIGSYVSSELPDLWPPWPETDLKAVFFSASSVSSQCREKIVASLNNRR